MQRIIKKLLAIIVLSLFCCNIGLADETSDIKLVQDYKDKLFESAIKSDLNQVEKICVQYKKDKAENVIIDSENILNWLCSGGLRPIFMDITYEYNEKFFNEKLSHVDICNEYKKLPIDASEYDQMSLNTHMGINNHCKTVEMRSKFKQDAKHNLIKNLDIEKLNFNFLSNKYYSLLIPEEEVTKKSTCYLNLKKEKRLNYLKIKERCGVKNITYQEESLSGSEGDLSTFDLKSERDLTSGWIIITDYFYADANKDDYMDLIIRFKNDGSYSMSTKTMTAVITSISENKYENGYYTIIQSASLLANTEMEKIIIDKINLYGKKVCNEEGYGDHYLEGNPITFADISNDGIFDIILDEKKQRCEKSASWFAGGTGGNNHIFFINPTLDIVKKWDPAEFFTNDKEKRIFTLLIRSYEIVEWNNKNAFKISSHGISCEVDGARGCYSILLASENGMENVDGPYPNNIIRNVIFSHPSMNDGKESTAPLTEKNKKIFKQNNIDLSYKEKIDIKWTGSCYIEYDGKIFINNQICEIDQDILQSKNKPLYLLIQNNDNFNVRVVKNVLCDDGSDDCAYYFYADFYNDKENKKIYQQINFNIDKKVKRYPANLGEDFNQVPYIISGKEVGICYIKKNDKFCWAY